MSMASPSLCTRLLVRSRKHQDLINYAYTITLQYLVNIFVSISVRFVAA